MYNASLSRTLRSWFLCSFSLMMMKKKAMRISQTFFRWLSPSLLRRDLEHGVYGRSFSRQSRRTERKRVCLKDGEGWICEMGVWEETRGTKPTFAGWFVNCRVIYFFFFFFLDYLWKWHVVLILWSVTWWMFGLLSESGGVVSFCEAENWWMMMGFVVLGLWEKINTMKSQPKYPRFDIKSNFLRISKIIYKIKNIF